MNLPVNQGLRAVPDITTGPVGNTADVYRSVVGQFQVEQQKRYRALFNDDGSLKDTWCNIFLWDVSSAFGCEIPHWVVKATQLPTDPMWGPTAADREELSANRTVKWLSTTGISKYGWKLVTRAGAYDSVNAGAFTIATFLNPMSHGHVAVCLPEVNGVHATGVGPLRTQEPPMRIAQAGADNYFDVPLERGFGRYPVSYYTRAA